MPEKNSSMKWKDENKENPLLTNDSLYNAALDEFARKSFNEASLNDILKAVKMNKGSFYYRFYDKMDLYLSIFHRIGLGKLAFMREKMTPVKEKDSRIQTGSMEESIKRIFQSEQESFVNSDFFEQISIMVRLGLMYARTESRYYDFWRNYLSEDNYIHSVIKTHFTEMANDAVEGMIIAAKNRGELKPSFSDAFLVGAVKLLLYNIDLLISPLMEDEEILKRVNELIEFMKNGLGETELCFKKPAEKGLL